LPEDVSGQDEVLLERDEVRSEQDEGPPKQDEDRQRFAAVVERLPEDRGALPAEPRKLRAPRDAPNGGREK
jgi:hypothetical protein